jgi:hypothetical protein
MKQSYVDGNRLAGDLRELFTVEMTVASGQCAGCGLAGPLGQARVFDELGPGLVARCPGCEAVLMRLVRGPGRTWLDLRGLTYLEVPTG